jgi:hypothetical protein
LFALVSSAVFYFVRIIWGTDAYLSDVSGLSAFVTVFGTLYGIMAAFVVFEVWSQWNKTSELIDLEGQGLERLFRLTLYFRDAKLEEAMKAVIKAYANGVIEGKFQKLGSGQRNTVNGKNFRKIADVIRDIKFDDDHDSIVYGQILEHYGQLGVVRTSRQNQSLQRLPILLKVFLYSASAFALLTFILMPFANQNYGFLAVSFLGFILAMIFQLVEDLDNPFVGHMNVTPESFERALKHIEEDY